MHHFEFRGRDLYCEDLKVKDLAERFGTPLYLYSAKTILDHFFKIKRAFSKIKPLICYSVKANSNLAILKILLDKGAGLDIVSGGELYRAKKIGCPSKRIVYASVGKTEREIREAIEYGILMFNIESSPELEQINSIASKLGKRVDVALRVNPQISPRTHKYITTAERETKFGIEIRKVREILLNKNYSHLNLVGLHLHIGSQITQSTPFLKAIRRVLPLIEEAKEKKKSLKYLNIGGGLGIVYDRERPQTADEFAKRVLPFLIKTSLKIILEPGRFIVGNAGVLVTRVLYLKDTPYKRFIVVDAAMNDLIRPALYGAYHKIVPLVRTQESRAKSQKLADVVGPVCEASDFLGRNRYLDVKEGDYLAILGCGAYGFSMSSNYNSRPRASEALVKNGRVFLIRERETYKDLVAKEMSWLKV
jgi:diaminopimelate decarboxylase